MINNSTLFKIALSFQMVAVACSTATFNSDSEIKKQYTRTIEIVFEQQNVRIDGDTINGIQIVVDDGNVNVQSVAAGVNYIIGGQTTEGSLCFSSREACCITLNNAEITSSQATPLRITSPNDTYLLLSSNSNNIITDATTEPIGDKITRKQWAGIYANGNLTIAGSGILTVSSITRQAIKTSGSLSVISNPIINAQSVKHHSITAKKNISICGGNITATSQADAKNALKSGGSISINNGTLTLECSGNASPKKKDLTDYKTAACIAADSSVIIRHGDVCLRATGDAAKGIKTDASFEMYGGLLMIQTSGTSVHGSAKGIKADGNVNISGGRIRILSSTSEGIESKNEMHISGGNITVEASDDALNAACHLHISGGNIIARSATNDAIDSNGNLCITGGTITAIGGQMPECGIDANDEEGYSVIITGGTMIAIGGWNSMPIQTKESQPIVTAQGKFDSATLTDIEGRVIMSFDKIITNTFKLSERQPPLPPDSLFIAHQMTRQLPPPNHELSYIFSSPSIVNGQKYSVSIGSEQKIDTEAQLAPQRPLMPMPPPMSQVKEQHYPQ